MKIVRESLADQVYNSIKNEILNGELKFGEKISEDSLAEQFGVSRTPIREALRRLTEYGLVVLAPRSHASISVISDDDAKDIADLRINLELFALDHIKEMGFSAMLPEISRHAADCQYSSSVGDRAKLFEEDSLFHQAIIKSTRNKALISAYERLDAKIQMLRVEQNESVNALSEYLNQHTMLIELLKNKEYEKAKALTIEHIKHESGRVFQK